MRNFLNLCCTVATMLFVGQAALAMQDGAIDEVAESKRFSGLYVGGGVGIAEGDVFVPLYAGLRYQLDSGWVFGAEGLAGIFEGDDPATNLLNVDDVVAVLGKVGYTPDNRTLFYGGVGYANGSVDINPDLAGLDVSDDGDGVVFEAGIEYLVTPWLGARASGQLYLLDNGSADNEFGAGAVSIFLNF